MWCNLILFPGIKIFRAHEEGLLHCFTPFYYLILHHTDSGIRTRKSSLLLLLGLSSVWQLIQRERSLKVNHFRGKKANRWEFCTGLARQEIKLELHQVSDTSKETMSEEFQTYCLENEVRKRIVNHRTGGNWGNVKRNLTSQIVRGLIRIDTERLSLTAELVHMGRLEEMEATQLLSFSCLLY